MAVLADCVVFVAPASDDDAWHRLEREAMLLDWLRPEVGTAVPDVFRRDAERRVQVRRRFDGILGHDIEAMVFGTTRSLPSRDRYRDDCPLTPAGQRLADDLGAVLARIHRVADIASGQTLGLPEHLEAIDFNQVAATLAAHVKSPLLERALDRARQWHDALQPDSAVTHGDPHMFNMVVEATTGALVGLLDYDDANIAHRHQDLRYVHSNGRPFARRVLSAYAAEAGQEVSEQQIERMHVLSAFHHFMFVSPTSERFPAIVDWTTAAVECLVPEWA